jgi:hypothetical protein
MGFESKKVPTVIPIISGYTCDYCDKYFDINTKYSTLSLPDDKEPIVFCDECTEKVLDQCVGYRRE